jgi:hypothetical protein
MTNPEKLAPLGTQDTGRTQTKQKIKHRKIRTLATQTHQKFTQVLTNGKQCLLLLSISDECYSKNVLSALIYISTILCTYLKKRSLKYPIENIS